MGGYIGQEPRQGPKIALAVAFPGALGQLGGEVGACAGATLRVGVGLITHRDTAPRAFLLRERPRFV